MKQLLVVFALIAILGCASANKERLLSESAQKYTEALVKGETAVAYSYFDESYKSKCSLGDFTTLMAFGRGLLFGNIEGKTVEAKASEVKVEGDKGSATTKIMIDGREVDFGSQRPANQGQGWVYRDGRWWIVGDDRGCKVPDILGTPTTAGALPRTPTPTAQWDRTLRVNQSQEKNGVTVTIEAISFGVPSRVMPNASLEQLRLMSLDKANYVVGLKVRTENRSGRDVTVYPGGIGALLLMEDEQAEPTLFGTGSIGGELLAGASMTTDMVFPLTRVNPENVRSFRYKFDDYDFTVTSTRQ